ncbi:MAG: undecaprenyl-phosphate glucose phosphotransferase [Bacteroidetes bacterium]|nr:undecaprenyl-phosphate glucose phosphotransferase [Bacteroidota bacterium]
MPGLYSRFIKPIHFIGDVLVINLSFLFSYYFTFGRFENFFGQHYLGLILFYNIAWVGTVYFLDVYNLYRVTGFLSIALNLFRHIFFYFILIIAFNGLATILSYSRHQILVSFAFITAGISVWRFSTYILLRLYRKSGYNYRKVVIAGFNDTAHDLHDFFVSHPEHGYKFMGMFDDEVNHLRVKGNLKEMEKFTVENEVDEIYCILPRLSSEQVYAITEFADNNFMRVKMIPGLMEFPYRKFKLDLYDFLPVISVRNIPLDDGFNKFFKRTFDIIFSFLVCTVLLSWLLPILAIVIKLDSKGPIFFKQKRTGLNNREFWCLKLRSMHVNEDAHSMQASSDDPRITSAGKLLRKFNLDELPQFINVFIGDMSIVGPRPHMLKHTEEYSQLIEKYMLRHFIKPGITGLSQAVGLRGETKETNLMKRRIKTDLYYIENWSFFLDIRIIFLTILNIFRGDKKAV